MRRRQALIGGGIAVVGAVAGGFVFHRSTSLDDYVDAASATRAALRQNPEAAELIRYATLAANGHNSQPWRFQVEAGGIRILPDYRRRTPVVDPDDHHLFVSLGGATENLAIAAASRGRPGSVTFNPDKPSLEFRFGEDSTAYTSLVDAIPRRQSTRTDYDGRPVATSALDALAKASLEPGVDTVLITDRAHIARIKDLVIAGNTAQIGDPAFVRELRTWVRFSPRRAMKTRDGLFSATTGNPVAPGWIGTSMFDLFFDAETENDKYRSAINSSAGIAIFVSQRDDAAHWVKAGRASQRFALQATALGLKCAYLNQPVEVSSLRAELASLAGLPGRRPDIVMRFGYGPAMPYSLRRPVSELLA